VLAQQLVDKDLEIHDLKGLVTIYRVTLQTGARLGNTAQQVLELVAPHHAQYVEAHGLTLEVSVLDDYTTRIDSDAADANSGAAG